MKKAYLSIPEKSQDESNPLIFVDPWKQYYRIGLDLELRTGRCCRMIRTACLAAMITCGRRCWYSLGSRDACDKRNGFKDRLILWIRRREEGGRECGQWEVGNRAEDGGRKTVVGKQKTWNVEPAPCTL